MVPILIEKRGRLYVRTAREDFPVLPEHEAPVLTGGTESKQGTVDHHRIVYGIATLQTHDFPADPVNDGLDPCIADLVEVRT